MNYSELYNLFINSYGWFSSKLPFGYALPPIRATIEITYDCNLHCQMCYLNPIKNKNGEKEEISVDQIQEVINKMPPKTLIGLTGGEIFTKPYIFDLINYAAKNHYCNIVTNGTLINQSIAKRIVASKVLVIGISIDGPEKIHDQIRGRKGSFRQSLNAIKLIVAEKKRQKKHNPKIDVKIVILPENYQHLWTIYELCQSLGVDFFTLSVLKTSPIQLSPPVLPVIPESFYKNLKQPNEKIDIKILAKQINRIEKNKSRVKIRFYPRKLSARLQDYYSGKTNILDYSSCTFPWTSFNISPKGDLFPCISLGVGNIKDQSLRSIWNNKKMRSFRQKLKRNKVFPACHGCCNLWFRNS